MSAIFSWSSLPGELPSQWYTSLPARDVSIGHGVAQARMVEAEMPGRTLQLTSEIRLDGGLRSRATICNLGREAEPAPVLYHCNVEAV